MVSFVFPPEIQAKIWSGAYELVRTGGGEALTVARDVATGRFVGQGRLVEEVWDNFIPTALEPLGRIPEIAHLTKEVIGINPLFAPAQMVTNLVTSGIEVFQVDRGF
jgi:hypothetical protein